MFRDRQGLRGSGPDNWIFSPGFTPALINRSASINPKGGKRQGNGLGRDIATGQIPDHHQGGLGRGVAPGADFHILDRRPVPS